MSEVNTAMEDALEQTMFRAYLDRCTSREDRMKLCKAYLAKHMPKPKYDPSEVMGDREVKDAPDLPSAEKVHSFVMDNKVYELRALSCRITVSDLDLTYRGDPYHMFQDLERNAAYKFASDIINKQLMTNLVNQNLHMQSKDFIFRLGVVRL